MFFFTYAFAQVPSNMVLVRLGGPLWLGIIVTCWGLVATCFAGWLPPPPPNKLSPLARTASACVRRRKKHQNLVTAHALPKFTCLGLK